MRAFLAFAAAWILALSTYGGVTPWARCGIFAVLLLGTLWVERGRPPALPWVGLAAMGLAVAQIIPLPVFLLPRLQAEAHLLHGHTWGTISLSPNATIVEAITLLSYLMAGTLGYRAVRQGLPLERAFLAAGTIGVAFSAYAIIALVGHHDSLLVWGRRLDLQSATGPFVNRNHFAGFLELLLPPALALTIVRLQRARREGRSAPLTDTFWQSLALGLGVVVMLTALVLSRS
ncbi:MAG: hypothetical protein HYY16_18470, partial [Planctomycetes bacterium]|nr:hypothetical protein [Planctomycetota bacterium]